LLAVAYAIGGPLEIGCRACSDVHHVLRSPSERPVCPRKPSASEFVLVPGLYRNHGEFRSGAGPLSVTTDQ
jgi:hypothetical protein